MSKKANTSWGKVADWYADHLQDEDTYHNKVILPNLLRLLDLKKSETVLELGCGEGIFTREIAGLAKRVTGVDLSAELIDLAVTAAEKLNLKNVEYFVAPASQTDLPAQSFDKALIVLALQNIKDMNETIAELARLMKKGSRAYIVLNHPNYRIIGQSSWQFDEKKNIQYRRTDSYMTESQNKIDMAPGKKNKTTDSFTFSFHRPLQVYFKAFQKNGLVVSRLEEWISHKKSEKGTRQTAEDNARKEFPLFMTIELLKL